MAKIQGICPNGWHLPSDYEWTELEQEISSNTSRYSGLPDAGTAITLGQIGWRGTTTNSHGQGMKDPCPAPNQTTYVNNGSSNVMSPAVLGGFNAILAGNALNGSAFDYGVFGYWWSASSESSNFAWIRYVASGGSQVYRGNRSRYYFLSVRCKKD
jgi:uncharacterized protein (TIGR02145 family)